MVDLLGHCAFGTNGSGVRGHLDAAPLVAVWRNRLYLFANRRCFSDWIGHRQYAGFRIVAAIETAARCARVVPSVVVWGDGVGGIHADRVFALVAGRSLDCEHSAIHTAIG